MVFHTKCLIIKYDYSHGYTMESINVYFSIQLEKKHYTAYIVDIKSLFFYLLQELHDIWYTIIHINDKCMPIQWCLCTVVYLTCLTRAWNCFKVYCMYWYFANTIQNHIGSFWQTILSNRTFCFKLRLFKLYKTTR